MLYPTLLSSPSILFGFRDTHYVHHLTVLVQISSGKPTRIMLPRLTRRFERAIWQSPQALSSRLTRGHPCDVVSEALHESCGFVVVRVLERDGVWDQLW